MEKYYPPQFKSNKFHCILCGVYSAQGWHKLFRITDGRYVADPLWSFNICSHCDEWCYWYEERMIVPSEAPVSPPHSEMPAECKPEYEEARDILSRSPRAAAALMRLALQKLMPLLGEKGSNINEDIASLVKKGLPVQIQQALDYCRVVGNHAVHPGEINLDDTPEIAHQLFMMMNYIVEDRISRPKHIQLLYDQLPLGAREAIEKRDKLSQ